MNALLALFVLAQRYTGRVQGIRDSFGEGDSEGGIGNLMLLLISAGIILVITLAWHQTRKGGRPLHSAMKLFRESVESLGLTREEKYLLERMIRELRLSEPARLLLDAPPDRGGMLTPFARHEVHTENRLDETAQPKNTAIGAVFRLFSVIHSASRVSDRMSPVEINR